jgi:hypothetical protein
VANALAKWYGNFVTGRVEEDNFVKHCDMRTQSMVAKREDFFVKQRRENTINGSKARTECILFNFELELLFITSTRSKRPLV